MPRQLPRKTSMDFSPLYEATARCIELQGQAESMHADAKMQFRAVIESDTEAGPEQAALLNEAVTLDRHARTASTGLKEIQDELFDRLGGSALSARVLSGLGSLEIRATYHSSGLYGSHQQETTSSPKRAKGTLTTLLLGYNALLLHPRMLSGDRMNTGVYIVPILRTMEGEPNVLLEERNHTWRDRDSPISRFMYRRVGYQDGLTSNIINLASRHALAPIRPVPAVANE